MNSRSYDNISFLKIFERMILCYRQDINSIPSKSLTQSTPGTDISGKRIGLNFLYQIIQVRIGKRVAVSKVHFIPRMWKHILPRKRIEWFIIRGTLTIPILKILYIFSSPMPADILLLRFLHRINNNLHTTLIQATLFV